MASTQQDSSQLTPITVTDLIDDSSYLIIPTATLQLQADTINVLEGRLPLSSFSEERQQQITNFYRFSADFQNRRAPQKPAKMNPNTLDLV